MEDVIKETLIFSKFKYRMDVRTMIVTEIEITIESKRRINILTLFFGKCFIGFSSLFGRRCIFENTHPVLEADKAKGRFLSKGTGICSESQCCKYSAAF